LGGKAGANQLLISEEATLLLARVQPPVVAVVFFPHLSSSSVTKFARFERGLLDSSTNETQAIFNYHH
jgi:hypothetical protein